VKRIALADGGKTPFRASRCITALDVTGPEIVLNVANHASGDSRTASWITARIDFFRTLLVVVAIAFVATSANSARAGMLEFNYRGYVSSDARFSLPGYFAKPDTGDHPRFLRNETEANLRLDISAGRHVKGVADMTLVYTGKRDERTLTDLGLRSKVDPFRVESDAMYIVFRDLGLEGLDLSIGRMILPWGTGDQFNPTRNLNSLDLEDRLMFGEGMANQMVVLEWSPGWYVEGEDDTIFDEMIFQLAVVLVFRGSLLPESSQVAFSAPKYARTRYHSQLMADLFDLQDAFAVRGGELSFDVSTANPSTNFRNVQVGAKVGFHLLGVDLSFSYYRGFDDMLQPEAVYVDDVTLPEGSTLSGASLLPIVENLCADGVSCLNGTDVHTKIRVGYPRIQVAGIDMSTSLDFLGGLGLWAEVAFVFHDDLQLQVRKPAAVVQMASGSGTYPAETVYAYEQKKDWFVKSVVGIDYSFTSWWYINVQYLHGFVDEFGADYLDDFIVAGSDFKLLDERLLIRIFALFCIQDQSTVLYPQITAKPWGGVELTVGALMYFGDEGSDFGTPLTGSSTVFVRGKFSF